MDGNVFIPSQSVRKQVRSGGGSPFQETFWAQFNSPLQYEERKITLRNNLREVVETNLPRDSRLYAEVKYSDVTTSKSTRPTDIWRASNLEVVQSTDEKTFTVSGKQEDFSKLSEIVLASDFQAAKHGSKVEGTSKKISREIFSVSSVRDKNKGEVNRVDTNIKRAIEFRQDGEIPCIIEIYPNRRINEYESLYRQLNGYISVEKIRKRDIHALFGNLSYFADLSIVEIEQILQDERFNFIRVIAAAPQYTSTRSVTNINPLNWTINRPITSEVFGIIDSGISSPVLNNLRFNSEKYEGIYLHEDKEHGTIVCSRALFGEDIAEVIAGRKTSLSPVGKFLDVQVLFKKNESDIDTVCEDDQLLKAIDEVTTKYPNIKIYNLSISSNKDLDERFPSELTERLDQLSREKDVLFICVTGNHTIGQLVDYNDIFSAHKTSSFLQPPGDTVASLTVGSRVGPVDEDAGATIENCPSPFTRAGVVRGIMRKPDLVAFGGNELSMQTVSAMPDPTIAGEISENKYGVIALGPDSPMKTNGCSFSAPIITNQAVQVLGAIKKSNLNNKLNCEGNIANLVKAFTVHSTSTWQAPLVRDKHIQKALGFGEPNVADLLVPSEDRVSIIYCDKLDNTTKIHKLAFELPEFAVTGDINFTFTLTSNPPVNRNHSKYSMIDVTGSVRVPYLTINDQNEEEIKFSYISPSKDWRNYTKKGNAIFHFNKRKRNGLRSRTVEVTVQMFYFDEYENENAARLDEIEQAYALVLTLEDMSKSGKLKQEMLLSNQIETLIQVEATVTT